MKDRGWPITIGGRRYRFDAAKYFEVAEDRPAEGPIAPDDERLRDLVRALTGDQSGASEGT